MSVTTQNPGNPPYPGLTQTFEKAPKFRSSRSPKGPFTVQRCVEAERRFNDLFENAVEGIYYATLEGKFLDVNPAFAKMLGYASPEQLLQEVVNIGPQLYVDQSLRSRFLAELLAHGAAYGLEYQAYRRDRSIIWLSVNVRANRDSKGNISYIEGFAENITARKQWERALEASERRFRRMFEEASIGISLLDNENCFTSVNGALKELLLAQEEMLGKTPFDFLAPEGKEAGGAFWKAMAMGKMEQASWEGQYRRTDGQTVWIANHVSTVRDTHGNLDFRLVMWEDVTAKRDSESQMTKLNAELKAQASSLARSNAELQQFAYTASHDLQEPIRMISSYLELLRRRYAGKLGTDAEDFIQYAVDGSHRMKNLIDDLLSYSILGQQALKLEPVSLGEICQDAERALRLRVEETQATFEYGKLPQVRVDRGQFLHLFYNLFSNALKFRADVAPRISVSATPVAHGYEICVQDNGMGFDMAYSERIFRVFQRLHSRSEFPGTGIGLSICQRVVENHGGRIWARSETGKGAAFLFTLPSSERTASPKSV